MVSLLYVSWRKVLHRSDYTDEKVLNSSDDIYRWKVIHSSNDIYLWKVIHRSDEIYRWKVIHSSDDIYLSSKSYLVCGPEARFMNHSVGWRVKWI